MEYSPQVIELIKQTHGYGHTLYEIRVPDGAQVSDEELVTRCDNRNFNLKETVGQSHHFGGSVRHFENGRKIVRVSID